MQLNQVTNLFIIDEVGKMELFSAQFFPAVWQIFNSDVPVLASIPIPKYGRDIPEGSYFYYKEDITNQNCGVTS